MRFMSALTLTVLAPFALAAVRPQEALEAPKPPDPNRTLTAAEAEALVEQITVLLDARIPWDHHRNVALNALSTEIHHRAALPAMRRLALDEQMNPRYRVTVLYHMVVLGVPDVLEDLIALLRHPEGLLRGHAWLILTMVYAPGGQFGFVPTRSIQENETAIKRWEEWWQDSQDTFEMPYLDPNAPVE